MDHICSEHMPGYRRDLGCSYWRRASTSITTTITYDRGCDGHCYGVILGVSVAGCVFLCLIWFSYKRFRSSCKAKHYHPSAVLAENHVNPHQLRHQSSRNELFPRSVENNDSFTASFFTAPPASVQMAALPTAQTIMSASNSSTQHKFCGNCGASLNVGNKFCVNCGAEINSLVRHS
jgi:hypothetical protein